ncbi:hypothetical protein UFOVP232_29 [uncultured Caudovirales phage]|uniref:Uncharacterized protein n=1 Tax=uncultured Caudovirales phage TaxID=2100421 RepID=A0A6J7WT96_9CAUD|nr:hypothetical protein UFOVP232_29 [uncultured Caudovirales phage]
MAKSHAEVGHDLHRCKLSKGSRMHVLPAAHSANLLQRTSLFEVLADGHSYSTEVVTLVRNTYTNMRELWITPIHHSQSTQRHVGYYRAAFVTWYQRNYPSVNAYDQIFQTRAVGNHSSRHDPLHAQARYAVCSTQLGDVDIPRTREATRRGVLAAVQFRLAVAMRDLTQGVPVDMVHAPTLYELQELSGFVDMLIANPDIDEVRAAVRAHIALNHPSNNRS